MPKKFLKKIAARGKSTPSKKEKIDPKNLTEIKEDITEIKEEMGKELEEILEDVQEIKKKQRSILTRISNRFLPEKFQLDDIAQQIAGAIVLSAPFAVTEEVWGLAQSIGFDRILLILAITIIFDILLIFYTKYQVVERKNVLGFIPIRLLSMLIISYVTAVAILYTFGVIGVRVTDPEWAFKLVIFVGLFSNIGAGTADLLR